MSHVFYGNLIYLPVLLYFLYSYQTPNAWSQFYNWFKNLKGEFAIFFIGLSDVPKYDIS